MITPEEIEAIRASAAPEAMRQAIHSFLGAASARIQRAEQTATLAEFDAELKQARILVHSARVLRVEMDKKP